MKKRVLASLSLCALATFAPGVLLQQASAQGAPTADGHQSPIDRLAPFPNPLAGPVVPPPPQPTLPTPTPLPTAAPTPRSPIYAPEVEPVISDAPPTSQAYVNTQSKDFDGQVFVPATFFSLHLGASVGPVGDRWRLAYFNHQIDFLPWQKWVVFDGKQSQLPTMTRVLNGELYV
ncbi:hypothetical protein EON80_33075, partial [bacterium]